MSYINTGFLAAPYIMLSNWREGFKKAGGVLCAVDSLDKPPHGFEPGYQRLAGASHDCAGGERMLMFTTITNIKSSFALPKTLFAALCTDQRQLLFPLGNYNCRQSNPQ
jgi:hypothetical protein